MVLLFHVMSSGLPLSGDQARWDDQDAYPHLWDLVSGGWGQLGYWTVGPLSHSMESQSLSLFTWDLQGSQTSYVAAQGSQKWKLLGLPKA